DYKHYSQQLEASFLSLHAQFISAIQLLKNNPCSAFFVKPSLDLNSVPENPPLLQQLVDYYDKNPLPSYRRKRHKERRVNLSDEDNVSDVSDGKTERRRSDRINNKGSFIDDSDGEVEIKDVFDMNFWRVEVRKVLLKKKTTSTAPAHKSKRTRAASPESDDYSSEDEARHPSTPVIRDGRRSFNATPLRTNDHSYSPSLSENNDSLSSPHYLDPLKNRKRPFENNNSFSEESSSQPNKKKKRCFSEGDGKPTSKQAAWYQSPFEVAPRFAQFLGVDRISKCDAYKKLWAYLIENKLQQEGLSGNAAIKMDETLKKVFDISDDYISNIWEFNNHVNLLFVVEKNVVNPVVQNVTSQPVVTKNIQQINELNNAIAASVAMSSGSNGLLMAKKENQEEILPESPVHSQTSPPLLPNSVGTTPNFNMSVSNTLEAAKKLPTKSSNISTFKGMVNNNAAIPPKGRPVSTSIPTRLPPHTSPHQWNGTVGNMAVMNFSNLPQQFLQTQSQFSQMHKAGGNPLSKAQLSLMIQQGHLQQQANARRDYMVQPTSHTPSPGPSIPGSNVEPK
ncbi:hypothetical protein AKO1_005871, partial [Acrasis kona]